MLPRLLDLYDEVAVDNYALVAAEFDAAATKFTEAAKRCDPEATGDSTVDQPDPVRSGWLDSIKYAADLNRLEPLLKTPAELAGIARFCDDDTMLQTLVIDTAGLHRRRLWEAWKTHGERCERWSGLAELGAKIRAWPAANLDSFEAYRTPKPLVRKQFPLGSPDSRGLYRVEVVDPEHEDYVPPVEEPPKRRPRRALAR
jgi:hypothetical protein